LRAANGQQRPDTNTVNEVTESSKVFEFDDLPDANLVVDAVYKGGPTSSFSHEPLSKLLPVGNQGGFRFRGSTIDFDIREIVNTCG